ncbi:MAG: hypothetical protein JNN18_00870 [Rubrivivax sp.]|jgi:hypothetical protein|nr:hypothetical protein [Rubrivivax sp.]
MGSTIAREAAAAPGRGAKAASKGRPWLGPLVVVWLVTAWMFGRSGLFTSGDDFSYWMAVVGGTMMLLVLLYPARKYLRGLRSLGHVRIWLHLHLVFGLLGPWLILSHSTFRLGSLNATVALWSMVIVVASGVIGRYLYVRVHRGLDGELTSLRELQARAGLTESDARSRLAFAPDVAVALLDCERRAMAVAPGLPGALMLVAGLPAQLWFAQRRCRRMLEAPLRAAAAERGWSDDELARRRRHAQLLIDRYLDAVQRVAQYSAIERVFALWHVAHMPFVVLLFLSAIVHVVAVHAY